VAAADEKARHLSVIFCAQKMFVNPERVALQARKGERLNLQMIWDLCAIDNL